VHNSQFLEGEGPLDKPATWRSLRRFSSLRPSLHRYCARMTGSVMDRPKTWCKRRYSRLSESLTS